jgi:hypothetical protein
MRSKRTVKRPALLVSGLPLLRRAHVSRSVWLPPRRCQIGARFESVDGTGFELLQHGQALGDNLLHHPPAFLVAHLLAKLHSCPRAPCCSTELPEEPEFHHRRAMCPQPPCPRSPVPAAFARLPRPCRESLLANDNVELLSIAERQGAGPSRDAFFRVRPRDDPDAGLRAGSSRFRLRSLPSPSCILPTTTSSSIGVVAPLAAHGWFADRQLSDPC